MDSSDLTKAQAREMCERVTPTLGYLIRLVERIDAERFPHDDPLRLAAVGAQHAMQDLTMRLHYMSCDGVWDVPEGSANRSAGA